MLGGHRDGADQDRDGGDAGKGHPGPAAVPGRLRRHPVVLGERVVLRGRGLWRGHHGFPSGDPPGIGGSAGGARGRSTPLGPPLRCGGARVADGLRPLSAGRA